MLCLCMAATATTTKQTLFGSSYANVPSKTTSQYWNIVGNNTSGASASTQVCTTPMPAAGTLGNIQVAFASAVDVASSGKGYNISLVQNGTVSGTATLSVLSAGTTGSYTGTAVHFAVDDLVCLNVAPTASNPANAPRMSWMMDFTPDTAGVTILLATTASVTLPANSTVRYMPLNGDATTANTVEAQGYMIFPMAGTITNLTVYLASTPGTGNTRRFYLRQCSGASCSSSTVGTSGTFTATQNGICSACPISQSVSVSAGDLFDLQWDLTAGTTPNASVAAWGVAFTPTTQGQFVIPVAGPTTKLSTSAPRYQPLAMTCCQGGGTAWPNATETSMQTLIYTTVMQLEGYYAWFDTSPSPGTYTVSLRLNAGAAGTTYSTGLTSQGPTSSSSFGTGYTLPTSVYDLYDTSIVPSSTPTAARLVMSYLGYIAPTGTSTKIRHSVRSE